MIHHPGFYDPADRVMLTHTMMKINEDFASLLSPAEIGFIDHAAQLAAIYLPSMVGEKAGWDGVRWFERLEETSPGSLARSLLSITAANLPDMPDPEPMETAVYRCVATWLTTRNIKLSYWGQAGLKL